MANGVQTTSKSEIGHARNAANIEQLTAYAANPG